MAKAAKRARSKSRATAFQAGARPPSSGRSPSTLYSSPYQPGAIIDDDTPPAASAAVGAASFISWAPLPDAPLAPVASASLAGSSLPRAATATPAARVASRAIPATAALALRGRGSGLTVSITVPPGVAWFDGREAEPVPQKSRRASEQTSRSAFGTAGWRLKPAPGGYRDGVSLDGHPGTAEASPSSMASCPRSLSTPSEASTFLALVGRPRRRHRLGLPGVPQPDPGRGGPGRPPRRRPAPPPGAGAGRAGRRGPHPPRLPGRRREPTAATKRGSTPASTSGPTRSRTDERALAGDLRPLELVEAGARRRGRGRGRGRRRCPAPSCRTNTASSPSMMVGTPKTA